MNNSISISVTCNDEETKERFMSLAEKMRNDSEFMSKLRLCKNEESAYELYKENGYTDLSFEDFVVHFRDSINQIINVQNREIFELSADDLENVVGGIDWFTSITNVISVIPIAGPLISGVAKAVKAGINGEGYAGIADNLIAGCTCAAVDLAVTCLTAGAGTVVSIGSKVALSAAKIGINEAIL